jgi:hypothetical protein
MAKGKVLDEAIDFLTLDGDEAPQPEPQPVEKPALSEAPAPQGQITAPEPVQPAAQAPQHGFVPLSAVLDEREKRQTAEKQLQELQRQQQPPKPAPDVTSDPKGWQAAQEERLMKYETDTKMQMSGTFAAQHYGQDVVDAAKAWGAQQNSNDRYFGVKFVEQPHPWKWLVEQHRQAQTLERLGSKSPDDWAIEHAKSLGYVLAEGAPAQQQPAPAQVVASPPAQQRQAPPRSIANAPPAGGTTAPATLKEEELLGGIFG